MVAYALSDISPVRKNCGFALGCGKECFGVSDEWHVDLPFFLILGRLGSYPVSPLSRFFRDLRAIRVSDRRAQVKCLA
jgi:hypothetical protein